MDKGDEVLTLSVQEMSKRTQTSPAALVRFSRAIGLDGFAQLKQKLSASLASMDHPDDFEEVQQNEEVASIKSKIRTRMSNMIEQTNDVLNDESVEKAAAMLDHASMIFVYGVGASSLVAQDIFQKFTRIGKKCLFFTRFTSVFILFSCLQTECCFYSYFKFRKNERINYTRNNCRKI